MSSRYEIELHYEKKDVLPSSQWIDRSVPIVVIKGRDSVFFEREGRQVIFNCGPLAVKLSERDYRTLIRGASILAKQQGQRTRSLKQRRPL